ncbi:MAG: thioredoxin fold domain-containing protein [Luteolibacter sp.]
MKLTSTFRAATAALLCCTGIALAGGEGWNSDFAAAKKEAQESKKDLILDFTGSDWCAYCIKLNEEVFKTDAFKSFAKDKFVLVEVDFPQDEKKLSDATKKQNEELAEKYPIEGYPTLILTDAEGRPYAVTGYEEGGAGPYVKNLEKLAAKKKVRDENLQAAEKAEGVAKAKALFAALEAMALPTELEKKFYGDLEEKIKAADPKDETGFAKKQAAAERVAKFQQSLQELGENGDFDGALALTDKTIAEGGLDPEALQQVTLTKAMILANQGKFDDAIKVVEEAKKIAPDSEITPKLGEFVSQLQEAKQQAAAEKAEQEKADKKPEEKKGE